MVNLRKTKLRERQPPQPPHGVVGRARAGPQVLDQSPEFELVHRRHYPARMAAMAQPWRRIAFLGPAGTFSEEALLSIPELAGAEPIAMATIADALDAANDRAVDAAFVPIENSIDGTVSATLDHLVFDVDLYIQLEYVLDVHLHLLAPPGTGSRPSRRVVSIPVALAQSRRFLQDRLRGAELVAATSTAEAARLVGEAPADGSAAIAPALAGRLYGLETLVEGVEDHADNQTRFVLVARGVLPPPTGHDRTSLVCFQQADRPGSLHQILGQFAARSLNLTKIESRPTKLGLGRLLLCHRARGSPERRGGRRLSEGAAHGACRRQGPRLLSRLRRTSARAPRADRGGAGRSRHLALDAPIARSTMRGFVSSRNDLPHPSMAAQGRMAPRRSTCSDGSSFEGRQNHGHDEGCTSER